MTLQKELTIAREHLALALTFTDNNPLKSTVLASARSTIAHCESKLARIERLKQLEAANALEVATYRALPFLKRLFTRKPLSLR